MLDLQCCRHDLGVPQQIHDQGAVEVADSDALGQAFLHEALHCRPRLLDCGLSGNHILAVVRESGGIPVGGVDPFERNREVDDVEVELVDAPIL